MDLAHLCNMYLTYFDPYPYIGSTLPPQRVPNCAFSSSL